MTLLASTLFVSHLLLHHLNVPEPVTVIWAQELQGFVPSSFRYPIASIRRQDPGWEIQLQPSEWQRLSPREQRLVLAHELCHAVYLDPDAWARLSEKQKRERHRRVDRCAARAIRAHEWEGR